MWCRETRESISVTSGVGPDAPRTSHTPRSWRPRTSLPRAARRRAVGRQAHLRARGRGERRRREARRGCLAGGGGARVSRLLHVRVVVVEDGEGEGGDAVPDAATASAPSCADATNLFVCAAESATTGATCGRPVLLRPAPQLLHHHQARRRRRRSCSLRRATRALRASRRAEGGAGGGEHGRGGCGGGGARRAARLRSRDVLELRGRAPSPPPPAPPRGRGAARRGPSRGGGAEAPRRRERRERAALDRRRDLGRLLGRRRHPVRAAVAADVVCGRAYHA